MKQKNIAHETSLIEEMISDLSLENPSFHTLNEIV